MAYSGEPSYFTPTVHPAHLALGLRGQPPSTRRGLAAAEGGHRQPTPEETPAWQRDV
jgi:hypothetical protein